jgi:ferredoxin-NADP reductase
MPTTIDVPIVQRRQIDDMTEVTCQLNGKEFPHKAGQHIQVTLPSLFFQDKKGNMRTFNILSSPNNDQYISFAFVNSDSAFKKTINQLPLKSQIQIKGAFGMFTLPSGDKDLVFISQGVGVVPCMSIILYATEENLTNKIKIIHCGKNKIPYEEDLKELENANSSLSVITKNGEIDSAFLKKNISKIENTIFYVSGFSQHIQKTKQALLQMNVQISNIKTEEFAGY